MQHTNSLLKSSPYSAGPGGACSSNCPTNSGGCASSHTATITGSPLRLQLLHGRIWPLLLLLPSRLLRRQQAVPAV